MSRRRYWQIDNLYAIGTVLVVLGHSHSSDWEHVRLASMIRFIYVFHMPLFFFLAGFLFSNSDALRRVGFHKWISDKTKKLMTPYIVLSIAALIPKYYYENKGFAGFTVQYLLEVALKPRIGVWGHFWFLPVLLLAYAIFGAWQSVQGGVIQKPWLAMTVAITATLYFLPINTFWLGLSDLKEALVFFSVGMGVYSIACNRVNEAPPRLLMIFWAIGAISITYWLTSTVKVSIYNETPVAKLFLSLFMISACWCLAALAGENRLATWLSRHNFTIYIYSWPFQAAVMVLCTKLGFGWLPMSVCMFITGFAAPCAIILAYERLGWLHNRFFDLMLGVK